MLQSLQGIQRTALGKPSKFTLLLLTSKGITRNETLKAPFISVLSLKDRSQVVLNEKEEELRKRIKWIAAASFAGGAIPVPGISIAVDIPLLVNEAR